MNAPLILVVSEDPYVEQRLVADIDRRLGMDYAVAGVPTAAAAWRRLEAADAVQDPVALVIVDERLQSAAPVDVLIRAHALHQHAKRVLLVHRGNWSSQALISAMAVGQVDYHLFAPWAPKERILYASLAEYLAAWESSLVAPEVPIRIVGEQWAPRSHELRDMLDRSGVPYWFYGPTSDEGRASLAEAGADGTRLPVVLFYTGERFVDPTNADIVSALGLKTRPTATSCDLIVVGAGPAGLAAAVYGASEGLDTLVFEPEIPGGQAGTSSLIRNYLGFRHGVSGAELTNRSLEQAWLFGADFVLTQNVTDLQADGDTRLVTTAGGSTVSARAVILATGVSWRRLPVPSLEALLGSGVFYGAAGAEARAMRGRPVVVVGGGNSAGQAAVHLARYARSVTMVVRGAGLSATMSEYLIREIAHDPSITVRPRTEVVDGGGIGVLESVTLADRATGRTEVVEAGAVFVLIGAEPHTDWLAGTLARDRGGYLLTGRDVATDPSCGWHLGRPPMLLETSVPGVFAAGDVRSRSVKRVAAAAGEGATAVRLVHAYLSGEEA